ncbi:hypothetical protein BKA80DRAFT_127140 [Phyllosticta citrichinensis]
MTVELACEFCVVDVFAMTGGRPRLSRGTKSPNRPPHARLFDVCSPKPRFCQAQGPSFPSPKANPLMTAPACTYTPHTPVRLRTMPRPISGSTSANARPQFELSHISRTMRSPRGSEAHSREASIPHRAHQTMSWLHINRKS